jgi:hypothetical protein
MYYEFCYHCGNSIDQNQVEGQTLVCKHCGQTLGVVSRPQQVVVETKPMQPQCPVCAQFVDVKASGGVTSFVPHFLPGQRKMCANSGKPAARAPSPEAGTAPPPRAHITSSGKDLSRHMTRDVIRVVACLGNDAPSVEELTLEYLDKSDRVRLQIDALRDILGPRFQMKAYPASLGRPDLAMWANDAGLVIARKHAQGGYQSMSDQELQAVLHELSVQRTLFGDS